MNEPIEIQLSEPIPFEGSTLSVLSLRRPKAGDFRGLKGLDKPFDMVLDLAATLSDLSPGVINRLDVADIPKLVEALGGFLAGFQGTGKT
jgi:hypothetical protein